MLISLFAHHYSCGWNFAMVDDKLLLMVGNGEANKEYDVLKMGGNSYGMELDHLSICRLWYFCN